MALPLSMLVHQVWRGCRKVASPPNGHRRAVTSPHLGEDGLAVAHRPGRTATGGTRRDGMAPPDALSTGSVGLGIGGDARARRLVGDRGAGDAGGGSGSAARGRPGDARRRRGRSGGPWSSGGARGGSSAGSGRRGGAGSGSGARGTPTRHRRPRRRADAVRAAMGDVIGRHGGGAGQEHRSEQQGVALGLLHESLTCRRGRTAAAGGCRAGCRRRRRRTTASHGRCPRRCPRTGRRCCSRTTAGRRSP